MIARKSWPLVGTACLGVTLLIVRLIEDSFQQMPGLRLYTMLISFAGSRLYPTETEGVVTGFIYGPVSTWLYLPVLLFTSQKAAVLFAGLTTFAATLVPLYLALRPHDVPEERTVRWWLFAVGALVFLNHPAFTMSFSTHVDAAGMMLMGSALVLAHRWRHAISLRQSVVLSLLIVLSVWAKQLLVPVVLVVPAFFHFQRTRGRRDFFLVLVGTGLLVSGLFLACYGRGLFLNMLTVPSSQPWKLSFSRGGMGPPSLPVYLAALVQMLIETVPFLVALLIFAVVPGSFSQESRSAAFFYFVVALAFFPTSALGPVKALGAQVGYLFIPYLWLMSTLTLLCDLLKREENQRRFLFWAMGVVAIVVLPWLREMGYTVYALRNQGADGPTTVEALVRDKSYACPWFPLPELLLRRRAIDTAMGLQERDLAGVRTPARQVLAHLPSEVRYLLVPAVYRDCANQGVSRFWPEFSRKLPTSTPLFFLCERPQPIN